MKLIVEIDGRREEYSVHEGTTVLGRDLDCDIPVISGSVSRRHMEIHFERGELTVRDLGSRNGVFVNDRKVEDALVRPGEVVRAGRAVLHFVRTGDMGAATTSAMPATSEPDAALEAENAPTPPNLPVLAGQSDEPTPAQDLPAVVASKPLAAKVMTPLVRRALIALLAITVLGVGLIWLRQRRIQMAAAEGILTPAAYDNHVLKALAMLREGKTDEAADYFSRLAQYRTQGAERLTARFFLDALAAEAQLAQDFGEHWDEALHAWEALQRNVDRPEAARDYARRRAEEINQEARNLALRDRALHIFEEGDYRAFLEEAGRIDPDSRFRQEINQRIVDARSRLTRQLTEEADKLAEAGRWGEAIERLREISKFVPDLREQMDRRIAQLEGHKADQANLEAGKRAVDRGDAAQAEQALRRIGDDSPYARERDVLLGDVANLQARRRAQALYDRGNAQEALDVLRQAGLSQDTLAGRISTVQDLAEALDREIEQFQFNRADAAAQRIMEVERDRDNHYHAKAAAYLRDREGYRRRHADQLLAEAKDAHRRRQYHDAREKAEAALRAYPRLQEAAAFIGTLRREAERAYNFEVLQHREADPAKALEAAREVRDRLRPGETFHTRAQQIIAELEARLRQE